MGNFRLPVGSVTFQEEMGSSVYAAASAPAAMAAMDMFRSSKLSNFKPALVLTLDYLFCSEPVCASSFPTSVRAMASTREVHWRHMALGSLGLSALEALVIFAKCFRCSLGSPPALSLCVIGTSNVEGWLHLELNMQRWPPFPWHMQYSLQFKHILQLIVVGFSECFPFSSLFTT